MKPKLSVTLGDLTPSWTTKRKLLRDRSVLFEPGNARRCERCGKWVATVDIAITCQTSAKALVEIFGAESRQTFESCMTSENDARAQIVKNWSSLRLEPDNAA